MNKELKIHQKKEKNIYIYIYRERERETERERERESIHFLWGQTMERENRKIL